MKWTSFIKVYAGVSAKAYIKMRWPSLTIGKEKLTSPERVFSIIQKSIKTAFSKKDIIFFVQIYHRKDNRKKHKKNYKSIKNKR